MEMQSDSRLKKIRPMNERSCASMYTQNNEKRRGYRRAMGSHCQGLQRSLLWNSYAPLVKRDATDDEIESQECNGQSRICSKRRQPPSP